MLALALAVVRLDAQANSASRQRSNLPPQVIEAERFLAHRGWRASAASSDRQAGVSVLFRRAKSSSARPQTATTGSESWLPLGPSAVLSQNFGLVTGRISALALDPSETAGNCLYAGSTGGGVWRSQNAGTSDASFSVLTDDLSALSGATDASISIGALTVQPGSIGTCGSSGVILAGTGDPNDALDSYYGAGILRSVDGGNTWSLIQSTSDNLYSFVGEGFAGFAWSTVNTNLVVAAVSQAYEGDLVNAVVSGVSYQGLYYSTDSGKNWSLATITDGTGQVVQGPSAAFALPDGNAVTSVAWNPVRQLFVAAVRYHGYYQSSDGVTWTRMSAQPGSGLAVSLNNCPVNIGYTGSTSCPIFRGALAVNPMTGDTFAWTVDINNQDQGLWQDKCAATSGSCASSTIWTAAHLLQWNTAALEASSPTDTTIANGDYNLALAAIPSGQETVVLAGANDLWKIDCPYSEGCRWRNTTNSTTCMSAEVGEYQHVLAWNVNNPLEIFVGNDSGLWRSLDAIGETGSVCASTDATHFQNLNGGLGSLAEVVSLSQAGATPYTMMAGLGDNGTAGVKSTSGVTADWPEILGGEGGPVAIDPQNSDKWYVNNAEGVSIHLCAQSAVCTPDDFGASAVVTDADVDEDGLTMTEPAPFLVDPLDSSQLLVGTCRVWRGPADGVNWSSTAVAGPILDKTGNSFCSGDALIRSLAAMALPVSTDLPSGGEVVYAGMYSNANGGAPLPGHVWSATYNAATGSWSTWTDLTSNPVGNDTHTLNYYGLDVSSIFIDSHDTSGNTVYVTVAGTPSLSKDVQRVYGSTDGGASWTALTSNLPDSSANSLVVDPLDASTVYIATDTGVYSTREMAIGSCDAVSPGCWTAFGSGLPQAPVVAVSAEPASAAAHNLIAATYGRGIWMTPLWTADESLTTATVSPDSLTFASQIYGTSSSAQTVTLTNTGTETLLPTHIVVSGDFRETDNCQNASVAAGASCTIQVTFTPTRAGSRTGMLTIVANVGGGDLTVSLNGTGTAPGVLNLTPSSISFGSWKVGATSTAQQVTVNNSGALVVVSSVVTGPFAIDTNACGSSVAADSSCNLTLTFTPVAAGAVTGTLTFTDADGTQTVTLNGTGLAAPTDTISPTSLTFPGTVIGQLSAAQTVTLANSGGVDLTSIAISVSGPFQQTNACTASLGARSSCAISVRFVPTAAGAQTGTLTIKDALLTQTVALSGTGLNPAIISVSPASLTFTGQTVGAASSPQTLTVSNTGGASMANVGFQITGVSASSFSTGTTTCGATLASGASCTVRVIFTPAEAGGAMASLVVSSSTSGVASVTVPLTGTGQSLTGINVSPSQLIFPIVAPGSSSAAQTVTLTNSGSSAATSLALTTAAPFSVSQTTCGATLAAGASCSAGVIFLPSLNISYTGTLTMASSSLASSATVLLSGAGGVPGSVAFQPSPLVFAQTGLGVTSAVSTVTITNPDSVTSLSNLTLTPSPAAEFNLASTTCGATLAAGASCTAGLTFTPARAGARSGTLTVSDSALTAGSTLALSGTGFDFKLCIGSSTTPCATTSSQTIANGQVASFHLTIAPLDGLSGSFTIACGSLPSSSSCTFSPTSPTPSSTASVYETVGIATGLSSSSARVERHAAWPALPLICGGLFLPLAFWRRRKALLLVALLAILTGGVSSCAGSNVGRSSNPGGSGTGITPAGNYSIPITVTSNGVSHQVTVVLTVD
jgi:hypothetical protein